MASIPCRCCCCYPVPCSIALYTSIVLYCTAPRRTAPYLFVKAEENGIVLAAGALRGGVETLHEVISIRGAILSRAWFLEGTDLSGGIQGLVDKDDDFLLPDDGDRVGGPGDGLVCCFHPEVLAGPAVEIVLGRQEAPLADTPVDGGFAAAVQAGEVRHVEVGDSEDADLAGFLVDIGSPGITYTGVEGYDGME